MLAQRENSKEISSQKYGQNLRIRDWFPNSWMQSLRPKQCSQYPASSSPCSWTPVYSERCQLTCKAHITQVFAVKRVQNNLYILLSELKVAFNFLDYWILSTHFLCHMCSNNVKVVSLELPKMLTSDICNEPKAHNYIPMAERARHCKSTDKCVPAHLHVDVLLDPFCSKLGFKIRPNSLLSTRKP